MTEGMTYAEMKERDKKAARLLASEIIKELSKCAKGLPYVVEVSEGDTGWEVAMHAYGKSNTMLCEARAKARETWRQKGGYRYGVFVSIRGAYMSRYPDLKTTTFRIASLDKLDNAKIKVAKCVMLSYEAEAEEKRENRERKAAERDAAKTLKHAGFKVTDYRGEEVDIDNDNDFYIFGAVVDGVRADGLTVGVRNTGEVVVRLPESMTLADFLKKLG
jgi:hypothetical protein